LFLSRANYVVTCIDFICRIDTNNGSIESIR
jgi:hypothetical protein